ncbi:MAG: 3-dehydroquinate synthase [Chthoniobacterales bacterium]
MSEADLEPLAVISMAIRDGARAIIGTGVLNRSGQFLDKNLGPRCAIVSDTNIAAHFGERLTEILKAAGFAPMLITIPAGEQFKTLEQAGAICDQMIAARLDRQSFVIGLGGGVIGDISGFVAAIFHRGISHVQIPTTLLAMVDSSIGGKTGVNTRDGKNLIGAIHHPVLVIDDVDLLKTLPPREFNQGFAEIIKHAVTSDAEMFEEVAQASVAGWKHALTSLIRRNIEIKAALVAKDERDRIGERALLNFGHTVGHAIERAGNYKTFLHGEAVSLGIVAACDISMKKADLAREQRDAIVDLLRAFDLPTQLPSNFPRAKIFEALPLDKKFESGKVRFVITPRIGSAYLSSDVTMEDLRESILQL